MGYASAMAYFQLLIIVIIANIFLNLGRGNDLNQKGGLTVYYFVIIVLLLVLKSFYLEFYDFI